MIGMPPRAVRREVPGPQPAVQPVGAVVARRWRGAAQRSEQVTLERDFPEGVRYTQLLQQRRRRGRVREPDLFVQ